MDLMKIFKRPKSMTRKRDIEAACREKVLVTPDNHPYPNFEKHVRCEKKSTQKSFRKKKHIRSTSCDDILKDSAMYSVTGKEVSAVSDLSQISKRWSYSPEYTGDNIARLPQSQCFHRHTETTLNNNQPCENVYSITGNPACFSFDACLVDQQTLPLVDNQCGGSSSDIKPQRNSSALFEHDTQSAFHEMTENPRINYRGRYDNPLGKKEDPSFSETSSHLAYSCEKEQHSNEDDVGDNSSWGSNEFESDSGDDSFAYSSNTLEESLDRIHATKSFIKKNRELSKDITDGMRRLMFLQRKGSTVKKNCRASDEELSSFVNVKMSKERHPGPHLKPPPTHLLPYQCRRRNILQTILDSESSYIDSLERLEISYKKALMESKSAIINAELVERIFYKIADILQCHQLFQIALTAAVNDWDKHEKIGDTFVASFSKAMVLECYSCYINNFTTAMELVRKACKQKPQFLGFLREQQADSENRLNLYGLMLKPVQRFPQFIMLVQDLLKNTPDGHKDYLPLQLALTELETLAENLNQRRADDEQRTEMIHLLESSNIKLQSNHTKDGRVRRLLKQGFIREITKNEEGVVEKDRKCLLVLTNDMLLSCSCTNRRQQARSSISTLRDSYKLKWCTALDILKIVDQRKGFYSTEQTKVKLDIDTLKFLSEAIKKLHYPLPGLSVEQVQLQISSLEAKLASSEKISDIDESILIQFPQKAGEFRRTLVMPDSILHNDWLDSIINAKLANDHKNLHCWFSADGSDSEQLWKPPLFLESVDCVESHKALQVQCAFAFMPACHLTLMWLACSASTVIATVNIYRIEDEKTEKVHVMQVESSVQCMERWCTGQDTSSVWLGMECGSLIEFDTLSTFSKICEVTMPTMSTVMIMKAFEKNLYAGLLDGSLVMYTRPEGHIGLIQVRSITVGSGPLNCLSLLKGKLWGTSGNDIITIKLENLTIESTRTIPTEGSMTVSHVVQVGSGFWVAFRDTCNLRLYHLESLKLLQDMNLSRPIRDFFQGSHGQVYGNCSITVLWSAHFQLLVGTSNGLILTMPLPRLAGSVPKITGPCLICYHTLSGPVQYLCAPEMPSSSPSETVFEIINEEENPPEIPERSPIKSIETTSSHKRTLSEEFLTITEKPQNDQTKRFSVAEPHAGPKPKFSKEFPGLVPPALPPKPSTPKKRSKTAEKMPEDDFLFRNSDAEQIPTPERRAENKWGDGKCRNFPVLLACGDGYKYNNTIGDYQPATSRTTSLLSWKIVL